MDYIQHLRSMVGNEKVIMVEQYHEENNNHSTYGSIKITSVKHLNKQYEVKWERKSS
ncbi:hypothetical protein P4H66_07985 [Paenibacillus dokdonensis]|uniref:Uncharacterized protein n=1 Tax=Paenibacillus dokdonensis TaxID=2567944 RepID=A0ABU6GJ70_9BACL|nr:hypothetical protein [Paenibacillus dokdonensis]MEC0239795.1 hypothetical protein [Paenibacillus dokdonensis]